MLFFLIPLDAGHIAFINNRHRTEACANFLLLLAKPFKKRFVSNKSMSFAIPRYNRIRAQTEFIGITCFKGS